MSKLFYCSSHRPFQSMNNLLWQTASREKVNNSEKHTALRTTWPRMCQFHTVSLRPTCLLKTKKYWVISKCVLLTFYTLSTWVKLCVRLQTKRVLGLKLVRKLLIRSADALLLALCSVAASVVGQTGSSLNWADRVSDLALKWFLSVLLAMSLRGLQGASLAQPHLTNLITEQTYPHTCIWERPPTQYSASAEGDVFEHHFWASLFCWYYV